MQSTDEIKKELKESLLIEYYNTDNRKSGGQHVSLPRTGVRVYCSEIGIEIKLTLYRSSLQNRELALTLMDLAIDEAIK